ncbi:hypothetical protein COX85_00285 [Candidatus Micrarchaeota archaeon CG_4_10_14_0_2_um_filter_55_9]|nr:MAG: hypothetical protein AUJ15_01290 [Candidatus Micrarchaeota archaeon CG1_02_55_41]PIO02518.1 MAG: hypothetical protein COT57_03510 [Candidatus Micrarchaeota archaeon CG09_land_8_20_14_0_10_55_25]PIZ92112.1 MAG: hypothetical protein COX85_00285 [Candidatus Micrarchaeota archaeon CG_4_10_14_0_2_um_filter_55_9]PJD01094.1 MAG: hypothetical protein COU38_02745 [Candidatus Micrarchaeota archaeon CG10_big_fil_rev_8_21_14_0_10_54_18]
MPEKKRLLVLCIDVDDDLGNKAKIRGPIVGEKKVLEAAQKLGVADPEDADVNTLFEAVRTYRELAKENEVEVAALTGHKKLGYKADASVAKQLENVVDSFKPEACIFVSDGASDERVLPIVQSRVRVDGVRTVYVKQEKDLEKTYFVILDKLKEPPFARVIFGVPGIALLLYFLFANEGIRLFLGLLGAYLILKGLGVEEMFFRYLATARVRPDSLGFVFYFASIPLLVVSVWLAASRVSALNYAGVTDASKLAAWFTKDLLLLLPLALLLLIVGGVVETIQKKKSYELPQYLIYGSSVILFWFIFNTAANWILGLTAFSSFFYALLLGVIALYLATYLTTQFKKSILSKMNLNGKEVYTELGSFLGTAVGTDKSGNALIIKTKSRQKIDLNLDYILSVGEKILVSY